MFDPTKPYYGLPLLPPTQSLESMELLRSLVDAAASLMKLSVTAENLPNQTALYRSVILLEAKASSEIEQIVTTDEKLFSSDLSGNFTDSMTKEVHRYADAIHFGWHEKRPLCTSLTEEICSIIKDKPMFVRKVPGTTLRRPSTGEIVYTPPDGEILIRDLLDNLFGWMNADDSLHPIIKAAIAHYQFESIHPFTDGNGRTGRILVVLYLVEQSLLKAPVLFISGEILKTKADYYALLQHTRETGDFGPYLNWFVTLVRKASLESTLRANNVRIAMMELKHLIRSLDSSIYSQDLVNAIFVSPLVFANRLVELGAVGSLSTAHTYLKKLEKAGLLVRSKKRFNRKVVYLNIRLIEALSGEVKLD